MESNKFTERFVNELYAILLGIGISNVLFDNAFKLDLNTVIAVSIAIIVLISYWFNWTHYIESDVNASKRELFIDFAILICLELLFVFSNNIEAIPFAFLMLGIFDFVWVVNFYYEKKNSNNIILANITSWIWQKTALIALYSMSLFVLNYSALSVINDTYKLIAIITIYIMGVKLTFNQGRNYYNISIVEAKPEDIKNILMIQNSNTLKNNENAFLLSIRTLKEFLDILNKESEHLLTIKENKTTIGYILLSESITPNYIEMSNLDEKHTKILSNEKYLYINGVSLDTNFQGKGIGKLVYKNLLKKYNYYNFYAHVAKEPYNNIVSSNFHEKLGFINAGQFRVEEFMGFKDYKSTLYFKRSEISGMSEKTHVAQ